MYGTDTVLEQKKGLPICNSLYFQQIQCSFILLDHKIIFIQAVALRIPGLTKSKPGLCWPPFHGILSNAGIHAFVLFRNILNYEAAIWSNIESWGTHLVPIFQPFDGRCGRALSPTCHLDSSSFRCAHIMGHYYQFDGPRFGLNRQAGFSLYRTQFVLSPGKEWDAKLVLFTKENCSYKLKIFSQDKCRWPKPQKEDLKWVTFVVLGHWFICLFQRIKSSVPILCRYMIMIRCNYSLSVMVN